MKSTSRLGVGAVRPCRSLNHCHRSLLKTLVFCALGVLSANGRTQGVLAPAGCPVFHCTVEATGVLQGGIVQQVPSIASNKLLGDLRYQGCSGDGRRLTCLYYRDKSAGSSAGTLKVLDATTLQPVWGSAGTPGSYDPVSAGTQGQVPLNLADGRIAAGDSSVHALYDANGIVLGQLPLGGKGNNFGLTPVSAAYVIVSQSDGALTLVDLTTWQSVDVLWLRDPKTSSAISLVSPSSGTDNVLYAIGVSSGVKKRGLLFAVTVDVARRKLVLRSSFAFAGRSGASPVVYASSLSGLPYSLVLVHAPGLLGEAQPSNRLIALMDDGVSLSPAWVLGLSAPLPVAPTIDPITQTLFYVYGSDTRIHQVNVLTGTPVGEFDIAATARMTAGFGLNGHLGAAQSGGTFTLLLSGSVPSGMGGAGQYVMAFEPIDMPGAMLWVRKIAGSADSHTAAWNLGPSMHTGISCPIVVGTSSGVTRLCDTGS